MSEMCYHKGKITPVSSKIDTESVCEEICLQNNWKKEEETDTWQYTLLNESDRKYMILNGVVYKVDDQKLDSMFFEAKELEGHAYEYMIGYYSGGCSFDEAIEEAVDSIKDTESGE